MEHASQKNEEYIKQQIQSTHYVKQNLQDFKQLFVATNNPTSHK